MPPSFGSNPAIAEKPNARPLWLLYACTCLVIAILIGADLTVSLNLRESTLRNNAANLHNISLALAEQADRAVQGVDLVLSNMAAFVVAEGADDAVAFPRKMAAQRVHELLREKLVGLPYINAVTMIDADGNLVNFSRYWPIPQVNVADRDYFKAMHDDPTLSRFVSAPVRNRGDDTWTVYLARRVPSRDGSFAGLLLGAIDLHYFEDLLSQRIARRRHRDLADAAGWRIAGALPLGRVDRRHLQAGWIACARWQHAGGDPRRQPAGR